MSKYRSKYEEMTACNITREALKHFKNSNAFIRNINKQYDLAFPTRIGSNLRIRLPNNYNNIMPTVSLQEAAVLGVAAIIAKNPIVSRRFWDIKNE